jgi:predicted DNA-binding mobile mystery protein A
MKSNFSELQLRQLDASLNRWRSADLPPRPPSGWVKAIRESLGMAAAHLAARLGVTTSTVTRLETSEADDTISLGTLRRAAEALGCELRYALIPKQSLADTLESRAMSSGASADGCCEPQHGAGGAIHLARDRRATNARPGRRTSQGVAPRPVERVE